MLYVYNVHSRGRKGAVRAVRRKQSRKPLDSSLVTAATAHCNYIYSSALYNLCLFILVNFSNTLLSSSIIINILHWAWYACKAHLNSFHLKISSRSCCSCRREQFPTLQGAASQGFIRQPGTFSGNQIFSNLLIIVRKTREPRIPVPTFFSDKIRKNTQNPEKYIIRQPGTFSGNQIFSYLLSNNLVCLP